MLISNALIVEERFKIVTNPAPQCVQEAILLCS